VHFDWRLHDGCDDRGAGGRGPNEANMPGS
jgi:hypothetical protein